MLDVRILWGTVRDRDAKERAVLNAREEMDRIVIEATGGGVILVRNWYPSDNWLFSTQPLRTVEDFKGKKIRLHSTALGDFIKGFNAEGQFAPAADVYTALERGILDGAFLCTTCGMGLKLAFKPCQLVQSTFAPMVDEAADGRVQIQVTSFPELGLAGPGTLRLVEDGSLGFTEVYAG